MSISINGSTGISGVVGTASTPALIGTDADTGLYFPTANEVALATAGSQRLLIDSSGNIVIGGTLTSGSFIPTSSTVPTNGIYLSAANTVAVATNGAGRLYVDASGNVGHKSTPASWDPDSGLSAIQLNGYGAIWNYYNNVQLAFNTYQSSTGDKYLTTDEAAKYTLDSSGNHVWYTASSGSANAAVTFSERLRITSAGLMGLGTSSPATPLDVVGNIRAVTSTTSATTVRIGNTGNNVFLGVENSTGGSNITGSTAYAGTITSNGPIQFSTVNGGSVQATLDASGRLGIGTVSPAQLLQINSTSVDARLHITNSVTGSTNSDGFQIQVNNSDVFFHLQEAGDIYFQSNSSTRATIDSSGRLLVGTSSSRSVDNQMVVQIEGTTQQTSSMSLTRNTNDGAPPNIVFGKSRGTTTGSSTIVQNGDTLGVITFLGADGTDINSKAASIEADIDGTPGTNDMPGRLVFSTTADGASAPTERMRINNAGTHSFFCTATTAGIMATSAAAGTSVVTFACRHSASSTTTGTDAMYVYSNGNLVNTNNSYGAISDIKLKENIVDASSQWDDLKALQVRNYNFKPETNQETHTQIGLIAQEVELVSPGLVSESPDRDEDGNDLGTVTKSVNYSVLYMKAIKALQEAMERIETLEAQNSDFATRLTALESA